MFTCERGLYYNILTQCEDAEYKKKVEVYFKFKKVINALLKTKYFINFRQEYEPEIEDVIRDYRMMTGINPKDDIFHPISSQEMRWYSNQFRQFDNIDTASLIEVIKKLLTKVETTHLKQYKLFPAMLLFRFLETTSGTDMIDTHPKFKQTVYSKITEFQKDCTSYVSEYYTKRYDVNKRYILKPKNTRYYRRKLITIIRVLYRFNTLLKIVRDKKGASSCIIC